MRPLAGNKASISRLVNNARTAIIGQEDTNARANCAATEERSNVRKTENTCRPGEVPGTRPLQIAGARAVRTRRIRQCTRNLRRLGACGARGQGVARQGELSGNRD